MLFLFVEDEFLHIASIVDNLVHVLLCLVPERDGFLIGVILLTLGSELVESCSDLLGAKFIPFQQ